MRCSKIDVRSGQNASKYGVTFDLGSCILRFFITVLLQRGGVGPTAFDLDQPDSINLPIIGLYAVWTLWGKSDNVVTDRQSWCVCIYVVITFPPVVSVLGWTCIDSLAFDQLSWVRLRHGWKWERAMTKWVNDYIVIWCESSRCGISNFKIWVISRQTSSAMQVHCIMRCWFVL